MLTVVVGDVVWDVDLPIRPLLSQAASGGAGVSVSFGLRVDSDVSSDQDGLIDVRVCRTNTGVDVSGKYTVRN